MWSRGSVKQAVLAFSAVPGDPAVGALARDTELFGDVRDGSAVVDHARDEQTTTMQIQPSVSVGREDLLGEWMTSTSPLSREVLPVHKTQAVTNVPAEYR